MSSKRAEQLIASALFYEHYKIKLNPKSSDEATIAKIIK
jgi:hypothetical protein